MAKENKKESPKTESEKKAALTKAAKPKPKKKTMRKSKTSNTAKKSATNKKKQKTAYSNTNQSMETMMTKGKVQMDKMTQDAAAMGKDNMDAMMKSGAIFAKGFEDIMRTAMSLTQDVMEKQTNYVKESLSVKTLNEWSEVQNKIAQTNFDEFMSGSTKLSEMSVKVLSEAAEPINTQLEKSVKTASKSMAA